ncbi:hypothetical protein DES34_108321 [Brevibacillus brevis]|nr:hypothetical protein DES34_108321 [Brevibacillus brevis]VEF91149.1 Uncharacterised protein [Brevibacillus brevis]
MSKRQVDNSLYLNVSLTETVWLQMTVLVVAQDNFDEVL